VLVPTEERHLRNAVRELGDAAAIGRQSQEEQLAALSDKVAALRDKEFANHNIDAALGEIRMKLDGITRQLGATANTVDQIGSIIPNLLRAQRLARVLFGPPFWFARFIYRRTRRGAPSGGASEAI
jgi:hypothetical protein